MSAYVHEEVEGEAEVEEPPGEGADGGEGAEVEVEDEDVGAGHSPRMRARMSSAALTFRAGMTTRAPRFASTRAVSAPIPDVAPVMMAVMAPRWSGVTSSAVDLEPNPLAPGEPSRYLAACSMMSVSSRRALPSEPRPSG